MEKLSPHDKRPIYYRQIRLDPKEAFAYNDRGNAYLTKEDLPRAIADYTEAIRLNSKYVSPHIGFRLLYLNRNGNKADWDLAIADCREAIRLDPKNARPTITAAKRKTLRRLSPTTPKPSSSTPISTPAAPTNCSAKRSS